MVETRSTKGDMMDVQCGMCGDMTNATRDTSLPHLNEGVICVPCQDYTMGYIYPEPVPAQQEISGDACSDYERWVKQRNTNVRNKASEK